MINLKTLEAFFWIVELGGFRKAAEKLNTTQPAISARIAQLEEELQVRLFDRNQGATVPTAKGAEMLLFARRMLELHNEMLASVGEPAVTRGTVRLGTAEVVAWAWLPELLEDIAHIYPLLNVEIQFDSSPNLQVALISGHVDLAFLDGPVTQPQVENVPLDTYALAWVASPALDMEEPFTIGNAQARPIITFGRTTSAYLGLSELLARADQRSIPIYSISSLALAVRLVKKGLGIGVLPAAALTSELASGDLRIVQSPEKLAVGHFTASFRKGPHARLLAAIANLAATHASQWRLAHVDAQGQDPAAAREAQHD